MEVCKSRVNYVHNKKYIVKQSSCEHWTLFNTYDEVDSYLSLLESHQKVLIIGG